MTNPAGGVDKSLSECKQPDAGVSSSTAVSIATAAS